MKKTGIHDCSKMFLCGIAVIVLTTVSSVGTQSEEDEIITCCQEESKEFADNEDQYVDKRIHDVNEPDLSGPEVESLQQRVYKKEKRQRPFECISRRTNETSRMKLKANSKYQDLEQRCKSKQDQPWCDYFYPYRKIDGTCNNQLFPRWGSVFNCLRRLCPQNYNDGVSEFRQSVCLKPLPDPRFLSLNVHHEKDRPNKDVTHMITFFGQFVAHDLTDVPTTFIGDKPIDCCSHPHQHQHPQCAPIFLREGDFFYSKFNVTCFDFVRASLCDSCCLGNRNQMNQETSFIDLSQVYGLEEVGAKNLRANDGTGTMRVQHKAVGDLLPAGVGTDYCGGPVKKHECYFIGGDRRVNQHTPLTTLQTLFLREHNRIAGYLSSMNPDWRDEKIYQEARKINIAQVQVIIYKELLPLLVGPKLMTRYGLWIRDKGRTFYDPYTDATLTAEFNTAAFRLHTLLNDVVTDYEVEKGKRLFRNESQDVTPLYHGKMDSLMEGITLSPAQKYDRFVAIDLTEYLYRRPNGAYGLDLAAVNIQRGRDNGLPTYTQVLEFIYGASNIQSFDDLELIDPVNINLLKDIYCNVRDIDLWVGLNNERVKDNMVVGPTAGEIIAMQFRDLKYGDRFYFEHDESFYDEQLQSLKEVTLSKIMCDNTRICSMQKNALMFPSCRNPVHLCEDIPGVDLRYWKEQNIKS